VWDVTRRLSDHLGKFILVTENIRLLANAASGLDGAPAPTKDTSPAGGGAKTTEIPAGGDAGAVGDQAAIPQPDQHPGPAAAGPAGGSPALIAGRILRTVLDLSYASAPTTVMLAIGMDGLSPDLVDSVQRLSGNPFLHDDNFTFHLVGATLAVGAIDGTALSVHGRTQAGSMKLPELGRNLSFLAQHA
jgi:hypothetical protein